MKSRSIVLVALISAMCGLIVIAWLWVGHERTESVALDVAPPSSDLAPAAQSLGSPRESGVERDARSPLRVEPSAEPNAKAAVTSTVTGRIYGRIYDAATAQLIASDVEIWVDARWTATVGRIGGGSTRAFQIAQLSKFDYPNLALGSWTLKVILAGYAPWTMDVSLRDNAPEAHVDIALVSNRVVRIHVHDRNDRPLWKSLSDAGLPADVVFVPRITNKCGQPGDKLSGLELQPARSRYVDDKSGDPHWEVDSFRSVSSCIALTLGDRVFDAQPLPLYGDDVTFTVALDEVLASLGSISACVERSSGGQPMVGAEVCIGGHSTTQRSVKTDDRGCVRAVGYLPGEWTVEVRASGFVTKRLQVDIPYSATVDLGVVVLEPSSSIAGRYTVPEGRLRMRILKALALADDGTPRSDAKWMSTNLQPSGEFEFPSVERSYYLLADKELPPPTGLSVVGQGEYEGALIVDARIGPVIDVQWMGRGRVVGAK